MKNKFLLFLLLVPSLLFSKTENNLEFNTISGFVSYKNKKLSNVTIFVEGTTRYAVTDDKGFYSIKAKPGEVISFSYVGLKKVVILIEDVTNTLNINMKIKDSITQLKPKKVLKLGETTIGDYFSDFNIITIEGKSLNKNATSLTRAIEEIVPGISVKINKFGEEIIFFKGRELDGPPIWIIDNVSYNIPIPIYISEVITVIVINSKTNGFTIGVKTNINYDKITGINYNNYYFSNDDYYQNDALLYKKIARQNPPYLKKYNKYIKEKEVLDIYSETYSKDKNSPNYHINLINFLEKEKYSKDIILKILADFEIFSANNVENLKGIAYKYQALNENKKALSIYKKIIKLRPEHRQSYRDVANTFLELKDYKNVWLTYHYYLNKGFKIEDNDIEEIISSELISAYNKDTKTNSPYKKIKLNNPSKNINSDVRLVFEWNTSEAEFILEFVNPDTLVYTLENSMDRNNDLIFDQKKKGYTSKEIFINDLKTGKWLVNFTYLGNKQPKPTFLKITTYYNWGRPNQSKKINVYNFTLQDTKVQLLKLNRKYF